MNPRKNSAFADRKPRQQLLVNVCSNVVLFIFNIFVSMWLVPFLIRHLGVESYGIVPLAMSITSYLGLLTLSINSSLGRFLTIDLKQGQFQSANRTFNTGFFTSLVLSSIVALISFGIVLAVPRILNIPVGQEFSTQLLFAMVMLTFIITTVESNFAISSWACNRFELRNGVAALSRLIQVAIVVTAFYFFNAQLWYVGIGIIGSAIISFAGSVVLWRYLTPQLSIQVNAFDRSKLWQITGMSGWILINQIGSLLFLNIDLIVVNRFFGAEMGGRYGAILQLSILLRSLAATLVSILTPTIIAKYAENDLLGMDRITRQSIKYLGMTMAIPIGLLCGFSKPILVLWLGPSFQGFTSLLIILSAHLCINLAVLPLFSLQVTYNKVRWPGIVTFIMGGANLILAIVLAKWSGWGVMGVALAGALVLTLKNSVFTPIYNAAIQGAPWWHFLFSMFPCLVGTIIVGYLSYAITLIFQINSWTELVFAGLLISIFYGGIAYIIGLKREERTLLRSLILRAA